MEYKSIEWLADEKALRLLDQRMLPGRVEYVDCASAQAVARAIKDMVIRGAPAIGAAAAYGLAVELCRCGSDDAALLLPLYRQADERLRSTRPTAVNLSWALDRVRARVEKRTHADGEALKSMFLQEAHAIARQDVATNKQIGRNALPLIPQKAQALHHCNTGGLATVAYGTALGIIRTAHERGHAISVLIDETRPRLQGARLTAWELQQLGIPHTLIVDGASGFYMQQGRVDFCIVGCDRVAANGDTANKIGTYNLALAAHAHQVPFYVAAPTSSIDMSITSGADIAIEERGAEEVLCIGAERLAPEGVAVGNPAFDLTPAKYISAIITERGLLRPPFEDALRALFARP